VDAWLTLLFQVMPVFFLVGGYSNAASWDAAQRTGTRYGTWVAGRARRLIGPVLPLILTWARDGVRVPPLRRELRDDPSRLDPRAGADVVSSPCTCWWCCWCR